MRAKHRRTDASRATSISRRNKMTVSTVDHDHDPVTFDEHRVRLDP